MADVFISYKREDRARVVLLAQALERLGYTVWWDINLVSGERWENRIRTELDAAKAVIVAWTANSVTNERAYSSEWVQIEANEAKRRGVLVPALLDEGRIPWTHQMVQSTDLIGWRGDPAQPGFVMLRKGIESLAGRPSAPPSEEVEAWIAAEKAGTPSAYRGFLERFARSRYAILAESRALEIEESEAWEALGPEPSLAAIKLFVGRFGDDGRFGAAAAARLKKLKPKRFRLSPAQIAAWIGVPTAALTLILTIASFGDQFFGGVEKKPSEAAAVEPAAPEPEPADTPATVSPAAAAEPAFLDSGTAPSTTRAPPPEVHSGRPAPGPVQITNPQWIKRPNGNDFARYYPTRAQEREREGKAVLDCIVRADSTLACSVVSEDPVEFGFGDAALELSRFFQIAPRLKDGGLSEGGRITLPLSFKIGREEGIALKLIEGLWGPDGDCEHPVTISIQAGKLTYSDAFGQPTIYTIVRASDDLIELQTNDGQRKTVFPKNLVMTFDTEHKRCRAD